MKIRNVALKDAARIAEIYNYYIKNTSVTFETDEVSAKEIQKRIAEYSKAYPWIVGEVNGNIAGFAYASKFRKRYAYRFTAETSIYLDKNCSGKGYGSKLYKELIRRTKKAGYRALIGVLALPNKYSVKLHRKLGFEKAGHLKKVGFKFGKWIDVGYWELFLR